MILHVSTLVQVITLYAALALCTLNVQTNNGAIIGHPAHPGSSVVEFLGVPFAQPPLGKLRFAPPEKYTGNGSHKASQWGFACPQSPAGPSSYPNLTAQAQRILYNFAGSDDIPQDEDCLTLNIWTKGSPKPMPVLIFFYGGRFSGGNTRSPFYNGYNLALNEDVVVVTVNYRVNIFGFPGSPDTKQNLGLRDQRLAVEWVRDNIAGFGGDTSKLTIWGQSSGGVSVDYWSYAYRSDPIVHGLISDSGNALSFPANLIENQVDNWYNVTRAVGCGENNPLPCMRRKRWQAIKAATAKVTPIRSGSPLRTIPPFYPIADGEIVVSNYIPLSRMGLFAKLPYLLGNNANEQGYYAIPAYANGVTATKAQGAKFLLSSFTCPNAFEARQRHKRGVPVYLYRYFGRWANVKLYEGSGAYHGTELEMIFGNSEAVSGIPPSGDEVRTSRLMQRAWAAFADDPVGGLEGIGWPRFEPGRRTLAAIAVGNEPRIRLVKPGVYDGKCGSVKLGGSPY